MSTEKKTLTVNGVQRMFLCDPERDTLADVLRRLGLTGVKVGCGKGMCGACSVLLNGKVVRSCCRKIASVPDDSVVDTVEGLGTAEKLHPLQLSWIVHGGAQCGFCTPGFLMSAKGLLDENPAPTREQVRAWFQQHRNACRCTGYKPIVDAVMDAARVLRKELTMDELAWKIPADGRIYNTNIPRPTAVAKVTGACDYGNDIAQKTPDVLHLAVVMPDVAHANILSVDYSAAEKAPGVYRILTAKDVKGVNRIAFPIGHPRTKGDGRERPILNDTKVFRYGDVIALVAADTERHARDAAKLVKLTLEPLPAYTEALDAMADDALEIHPGVPNIVLQVPLQKGEEARGVIDGAAYAVSGSFYTTREPHMPIEPEVGQAYPDGDGGLVIHLKTHGLYLCQALIHDGIGLPPEKIRLIQNPTGGSFGYALSPGFPALLGVAALATGRAVSLTMSYAEHMHYTGKRAASYSNGRLACDENGRLTAGEFEIAYDKGSFSEFAAGLLDMGIAFWGAPYYIPNISGVAKAVFSNQAFSTAYRGFGSPQTLTCSEQLVDMLAEKAGIDPFEFRYRNVYRPGDAGATGYPFKVYPMRGILDKLRPKYDALVARAKRLSTPEKLRGVGLACGSFKVGDPVDHAEVALALNPDGSVTNYSTWEDIGQGADVGILVHTHEALRPLGLTPDKIHMVMNDTGLCPDSGVAAGSRGHFACGTAIIDAANKLMAAMRKPDGTYRTYQEMTDEGIPTKYLGVYDTDKRHTPLDPNNGQGDMVMDYSYSAYVADVEVEAATGKVRVLAFHCVADVGVVGNYLALDGQAYGGMSHCVGFALSEDYSDVKKHDNMIGAGFPYIEAIPDGEDFTVSYNQTPRPDGPQGSGGASETFQSSGHVAILNAIYHACGVRVYRLPANPETVKRLLTEKAAGGQQPPEPYYLGGDMYDFLEDCKRNPV